MWLWSHPKATKELWQPKLLSTKSVHGDNCCGAFALSNCRPPPESLFVPHIFDSTVIASIQRPACRSSPSRRWPPDHAAQYREGAGGGNQLSLRSQLTVSGAESIRNEFSLAWVRFASIRCAVTASNKLVARGSDCCGAFALSICRPPPESPSRPARRKAVDGQLREGGQRATR